MITSLFRQCRIAIRTLSKSPELLIGAVVALGLGIGANTAIFSLVNALLWKGMPAVQADGLVALYTREGDQAPGISAYMDFLDFRERSITFDELAAFKARPMDLGAGGINERIDGMLVSHSYFATLGVEAALGRFFMPAEDETPGGEAVAVLSHQLWQQRYSGDRSIIGQPLRLNGLAFTIVGVAAEGFRGTTLLDRPQVFVPMAMQPHFMPSAGHLLDKRGWQGISVVGRLAEGRSIQAAQREIDTLGHAIAEAYPRTNSGRRYELVDLRTSTLPPAMRSDIARVGLLLTAMVAIVLLVASVNVAGLLVTHARNRRKEIAVRAALGASRRQLVFSLLVESVLLATAGAGFGLLLAMWVADTLVHLDLPLHLDLALDLRVLAFTAAAAFIASLVAGLLPALRSTRLPITQVMGRQAIDPRRGGRWRLGHLLIVGQVALSVLLAIAASLLLRTLGALSQTDPGFDPERVLIAAVDPSLQGYKGPATGAFFTALLDQVRQLPGVERASLASAVVGPDNDSREHIFLRGFSTPDGRPATVGVAIVGGDYFETLRIPLVEGRTFAATDRPDARPVVIANQTAARWLREVAGREPIGQGISMQGPDGPFMDIIGVAADSKITSIRDEPFPFLYFYLPQAAAQIDIARMTLVARTGGPPEALAPAVRQVIASLDEHLPVRNLTSLRAHLDSTLFQERLIAAPISIAAVLALTLVAVGLSGLLAHAVSSRFHEIGVRMALGARRRAVRAMIIRQGLALTTAGIVLGVIAAAVGSRVLERFLYGIERFDPTSYVSAVVIMLGVATFASYWPARTATQVDPLVALRRE